MKLFIYKILFTLAITFLLIPLKDVGAVEVVKSSEFFTIELSSETQSAWTQRIPLVLKFRANRDAEKTEISWDVPSGIIITENHPQFVSVEEGQVYTFTASVKPDRPGTYNIAANVTAWEVNTNYLSSSNITLKFDENLIQDPPAADYSTSLLIKNVVLVIGGIILAGLAVFGLKFVFGRLVEWLKPPE